MTERSEGVRAPQFMRVIRVTDTLTEEEAERDAELIGKHLERGGERALVRADPSHGDGARRRLHERRTDPDAHGVEGTKPNHRSQCILPMCAAVDTNYEYYSYIV